MSSSAYANAMHELDMSRTDHQSGPAANAQSALMVAIRELRAVVGEAHVKDRP